MVAAVGLLAGAGCGADRSGGPKGTPTDVVLGAIDHTQGLASARFTIGVGEVAAGSGQVVWIGGAGPGGTTTTGSSTPEVETRVSMTLQPVRAAAATGTGPVDIVLIGPEAFVRGSATNGAWIEGPAQDVAVRLAASAPAVAAVLSRPGAGLALDQLRGASSILTYGGAEVRGASTLRYTVRVAPAQAATAAAGPAASELQAAVDGQAASYPTDVWIDGGSRILRIQLPKDPRATVTTLSEDSVAFGVTTVDLMDFGVPVTITAPSGATPLAGS